MAAPIWLVDPDGVRAQAPAKEAERLSAVGWRPATEPGPTDLVWTRHEQLGTYVPFAVEVLPVWQARGWQPAVPPMAEGDVGPYVDLTSEKEKDRA
jgi:hypothetical protein